jgi:hypothetical protein
LDAIRGLEFLLVFWRARVAEDGFDIVPDRVSTPASGRLAILTVP